MYYAKNFFASSMIATELIVPILEAPALSISRAAW
jgi:hypothetical protein